MLKRSNDCFSSTKISTKRTWELRRLFYAISIGGKRGEAFALVFLTDSSGDLLSLVQYNEGEVLD